MDFSLSSPGNSQVKIHIGLQLASANRWAIKQAVISLTAERPPGNGETGSFLRPRFGLGKHRIIRQVTAVRDFAPR